MSEFVNFQEIGVLLTCCTLSACKQSCSVINFWLSNIQYCFLPDFPKHQTVVVNLSQELAGKNAEMMEEVARVRLSLNSRIEQLENDCRSNRVSVLEKELSGQFVQIQHYFRLR